MSREKPAAIVTLAQKWPFIRQIDVVLPASEDLARELSAIEHSYTAVTSSAVDFVDRARKAISEGTIGALSLGTGDDLWCIDHRGILTLNVCKETYHRLGLVGERLPLKQHRDEYVIRVPLTHSENSPKPTVKSRRALEILDEVQHNRARKPWDIVLYSDLNDIFNGEVRLTRFETQTTENVHVPSMTLHQAESDVPKSEDDILERKEQISSLFEWLGMACLGAQRLGVHDRVDPYICFYGPPSPSTVGSVTRMTWKGFLSPAFVQKIMTVTTAFICDTGSDPDPAKFVGMTAHAVSRSPVTRISTSILAAGSSSGKQAALAPRSVQAPADDMWSLILTPGREADNPAWILVESTGGQFNTKSSS